MAFFKKFTSGRADKAGQARIDAIAAERQRKWDELEAMVHDEKSSAAKLEEETPAAPDPLEDLKRQEADLEAKYGLLEENFVGDQRENSYKTDLTANFDGDAPTIDVTPDMSAAIAPALLAKPNTPKPKLQSAPQSSAPQASASAQTMETPQQDVRPSYNIPPAPAREGRADLSAMRLDVARIASDIQSGEELYRRAQKRIENLTGFVEKAEIDFSLLNRLEPENRRLKARNRTLESEIDEKTRTMEVLRNDLEDHQRRLAERNHTYEQAQSKLTTAQKSLQEYERVLRTAREMADRHALNAERGQTSLEVERRENENLRNKLTELTAENDERITGYIEAKKIADSLAQDCHEFRVQADSAQKEVNELRTALSAAQTQNNQMKGEMLSLHEDIRTFKTQYEFNVISREDEITAMSQQIDTLKRQLEVKDDIVRNAARDVTELRKIRTAQDLERERLEAQVEAQSFQIEQVNSNLLQTQQDVSDFDRRYRDVTAALSVAQTRREGNAPAQAPDIQPAPPLHAPRPQMESLPEDLRDITDDEIVDRITDYKLGLREDIV